MKFHTSLCLLALTVSLAGHANTDSLEQLYAVNQDYAKCLDVVLGNFKSDAEAQEVMSKFYKAITANTEQLLEMQLQANDEGMLAF